MDAGNRVTGLDQRFRNQQTAEGMLVDGAVACLRLSLQVTPGIAVARESGVVFGVHLDKDARVSQSLWIKSRRLPRLRGRPGFLAGWPAQGMSCEIWRR